MLGKKKSLKTLVLVAMWGSREFQKAVVAA